MEYYVSFPGLGIDPFRMNEDAFSLFGLPIKWYGVIITVGMIIAFAYALSRAKIEKIKSDDIYDLFIFTVLFGVMGARLYYVLFELDSFVVKGSFLKTLVNILSLRDGGLAIYGGIIAGFFTVLIVSKVKKMRFSVLLDVVSPAVMIGQIVGRYGNFVNMEAFGRETTLPWRMGLLSSFNGGESFFSEMYVHPTFFYESLWNLIGLVLIHIFYKKKKFNGQIFFFYISWYGFGRMFIEGLRTDSLMIGPFRVSQLLAAATFIVGVVFTVINFVNLKRYNKMIKQGSQNILSTEENEGFSEMTNESLIESEDSEVKKEKEESDTAEQKAETSEEN